MRYACWRNCEVSLESEVWSPKSGVQGLRKNDLRLPTSDSRLMNDVAAILLAAGRSRRMGAFKPLLPFGDSTVVEHCVNNLREAGIEEITVVVSHRANDVRQQLSNFNVSFAVNPDPDSEMSASIAFGVEQAGKTMKAIIVALVDHPAVPPQIVKQLIDEWQSEGARLIQPEYEGRGGHPVLIDLAYRDELMNLDARRGLRALFGAHRNEVRRLAVYSPFVARDMDTWEDYLGLHQDVFGRLPEQV